MWKVWSPYYNLDEEEFNSYNEAYDFMVDCHGSEASLEMFIEEGLAAIEDVV